MRYSAEDLQQLFHLFRYIFPTADRTIPRRMPHYSFSAASLFPISNKATGSAAQDGILYNTRWHLVLLKMASCACKGYVFKKRRISLLLAKVL